MKKLKIISSPNLKIQANRTEVNNIKRKEFKIDKKYFLSIYKNKKFFIRTYGCQANVIDSEFIVQILLDLGLKQTNDINQANLVILNTCAIRENAENKVLGEIGLLVKNKRKIKDFNLGICGCMPQEEKIAKALTNNVNVDFIFGTHNINELPQILYDVYKNNKKVVNIKYKKDDFFHICKRKIDQNFKAFVTIMDGCNHFCTYCIVPYTRGQQISRPKEDIINEIKQLIKNGCKEITLIGQNVNDYGLDFKNKNYVFHNLLEDVAKLNIKRIRFSTSNPWNFDYKVIDVIKKYSNIMPFFHLPIQSGDEIILQKMNRRMLIKDYVNLINYIKQNIPNAAISTDIIVGFPNESNKQFKNTLKLFKKVKYDNAYTFIYSKREGTGAAKMEDLIRLEIKQKRLAKLNKLVRKYAKKNNLKYKNKVLEVLVEGVSKTNKNKLTGYSKQLKVVNFAGNAKPGDNVKVKIDLANRFSLEGKQINN